MHAKVIVGICSSVVLASLLGGCGRDARSALTVVAPTTPSSVDTKSVERPWKARFLWTATSADFNPAHISARCSVPSTYVVYAEFAGEETHVGHVTGTASHCEQVLAPGNATYSDGVWEMTTANGETIKGRYMNGTAIKDPQTGETILHDTWVFDSGTGMFAGISGSGEEGGSFMPPPGGSLLRFPIPMDQTGTITYAPGRGGN